MLNQPLTVDVVHSPEGPPRARASTGAPPVQAFSPSGSTPQATQRKAVVPQSAMRRAIAALKVDSTTSSSRSSSSASSESEEPVFVAQPSPKVMPLHQQHRNPLDMTERTTEPLCETIEDAMANERVAGDHKLITLWAQITGLSSDIITSVQTTLPSEHIRALTSHHKQLLAITPQITASIHDTLSISDVSHGRCHSLDSTGSSVTLGSRSPRMASFRSDASGTGAPNTRASNALDLVDTFRDDVQLLVRHHQTSLETRLKRRELQIAEVRNTNAMLQSQKERLLKHRARKAAEDEQHLLSLSSAEQGVRQILNELATRILAHQTRDAEIDKSLGAEGVLDELNNERCVLSAVPVELSFFVHEMKRETRAVNGCLTFVTETESAEARSNRWKHRMATAIYPEAFAEYVEEASNTIAGQRQAYADAMVPVEGLLEKVVDVENSNKYRKMTRNRSPVRTHSGRNSARSVSPCLPDFRSSQRMQPQQQAQPQTQGTQRAAPAAPGAGAGTTGVQSSRPISPSQFSDRQPMSPLSQDFSVPPDTARTNISLGGRSRSPSRREAAFRPNGMLHVATSEQAVDHLLLPRQSNPTTARTNGGEPLPSTKTLLVRKDRLAGQLQELQRLAKREMLLQLNLLNKARDAANRRAAHEQRKREALVPEAA